MANGSVVTGRGLVPLRAVDKAPASKKNLKVVLEHFFGLVESVYSLTPYHSLLRLPLPEIGIKYVIQIYYC